MDYGRAMLIRRAINIRMEISQLFADAEHFNITHPNMQPIDPDPDGKLRRMAESIDKMLEKELRR